MPRLNLAERAWYIAVAIVVIVAVFAVIFAELTPT